MKQLLNEEYHNLGTNKIYKELWLYPQIDQININYIKPYGGFWTSFQNKYCISDWINYKEEDIENQEILSFYYSLKSCLVKYKQNSKFIYINNENDYKNLKDSGFIKKIDKPFELGYYKRYLVDELIDYEKLSKFYDLIYVNPHAKEILQNYSIKTMFALNPEAIEYYKPIDVDYDTYTITKTYEKEYIKEPDKKFYNFVNYVKNLYKDNNKKDYNDYIIDLYNEQKRIIEYLKNNNPFSFEDIDNKLLIENVTKNIYREKYLEKQKTLIKK